MKKVVVVGLLAMAIVGLVVTQAFAQGLELCVDIKPGSCPSAVNWNGEGKVPVAIFGSADFCVRCINPACVEMNGEGVALKPDGSPMASYSDVNCDGYRDLVVQIEDTGADVFPAGTTWATITGCLCDGTPFTGMGDIKLID